MFSKFIKRLSWYFTSFIIGILVPIGIIWNICSAISDKRIKSEFRSNGGDTAIATIVRKDGPRLTYEVKYNGEYYCDEILVKRRVMVNTQIGDKFPALVLKDKIEHHKKGILFPSYISIILTPFPKNYQGREIEVARIDSMYYKNKLLH